MARFHKFCKLLYFFYTFLFISSISLLDNDVNGVPDISQDFDEEDLAIFSTKIDELNVSVAIARGRHFESPLTSARRRRFHQARVIYYSNSCATFNVDTYCYVETFKLTLVLVVTALADLTLITTGPRRIFFAVCHLTQGQSAISWMSSMT